MKTPPFLVGAGLLFWGWQTGFMVPAIVMALILEGSRWVEARWDLADEDFTRIWIFCTLSFLGAAIYAFTANEGPADFRGLFQNPNFFTQRNAGTASAKTAAAVIRWLPMIFFFFIAAQAFSSREGIPLETISLIVRRRWKRALKAGLRPPATRSLNIAYPYLGVCMFAASSHSGEDTTFFWGVSALLAWALWPKRSRRFRVALWAGAFCLAIALGYGGQRGIGHLQRYFEGINSQWLSGYTRRSFDPTRTRTALGQIGRIKTSGKIVIRLEPKGASGPPPLLRESSYRTYKAQTWYSGNIRNDFEPVNEVITNRGTWVLLPNKNNTASVQIACYLDRQRGLLPLVAGSGRLEHLSAYLLHKNKGGAVMAEGPGLVMFDDLYGPGESIDSPPDDEEDTYVSPRESTALETVLTELQLKDHDGLEQKLKVLNRFFQDKFTYSTWQDRNLSSNTNETPLARFLLRTRSGHCEYFATATALLLRQLEVPVRYAVGYSVHERSGDKYIVRQRDAHAWCLVWNDEQHRWQDFDTTPASWVQAESKRASSIQFLSDLWSQIRFEFSKLRWGHSRVRQYVLWFLVPVLGILLVQIIFRSHRRRRARRNEQTVGSVWPGLDSEFYQLEQRLVARGLKRQTGQPLAEWLTHALAEPAVREVQQPLQELLRLHYRYRFDPQGLSRAERQRLRYHANECVAHLSRFTNLVRH